jgi:hypothetical protein
VITLLCVPDDAQASGCQVWMREQRSNMCTDFKSAFRMCLFACVISKKEIFALEKFESRHEKSWISVELAAGFNFDWSRLQPMSDSLMDRSHKHKHIFIMHRSITGFVSAHLLTLTRFFVCIAGLGCHG